MATNRRFYGFNSVEIVKEHIAQCKTLDDILQLAQDIQVSGTNLTYFIQGNPGVFAIDCCAETPTYRHVFLTKEAFTRHGAIVGMPGPHTWSVLDV
jgi:hypothetical protein